jgi:hypothetical protein
MIEKKTRKQIFEEKWLPKLKESNKVKDIKYTEGIARITTWYDKKLFYNPDSNTITFTDIHTEFDNGLKWLIKDLQL